MNEDLWLGLLLMSLYGICLIGILRVLRRHFSLAGSAALSVPVCQALISLLFQLRYLTGLSFLHPSLVLCLILGCLTYAWKDRLGLVEDAKRISTFLKSEILISAVFLPTIAYAFFQVLFLLPNNHDALVYHLPRVFLFIQQDTLLLDAFSRYHQAVFPVAADILFLPFVELGTLRGIGIYSLTSYLSIGATVYLLSRRHASRHIAAVTALVLLSLPMLVLQSVSAKPDLLMAATGAAALLLSLHSAGTGSKFVPLITFLLLCAYGIGCKATFIAFLPGLVAVIIVNWKLYRLENLKALLPDLRRQWLTAACSVLAISILSQVWLFAWNAQEHDSWSGPKSFTERHQQHDGIKGAAANALRYSLQIAQAGPWTDLVLSHSLGVDPFSVQLNRFYENQFKPALKEHGASRESFEANWRLHEDWAWFGPLGALICFIILPFSLYRKPSLVIELLPALVYLCVICIMISWMPWNGRFFTLFFICLAPAVAFTTRMTHPVLVSVFALLAGCFLISTKVFDLSRPLISIEGPLYKEGNRQFWPALTSAFEQANAWSKESRVAPLHKGEPDTLLSEVEPGASVGIFINSHFRHYGFYAARPELTWYPLNHLRGSEPKELSEAWAVFVASNLDYLLCAGVYSEELNSFLINESEDGTAHLIRNPSQGLGPPPSLTP